MFISQQLRKDNIAEYLLYMWQVEDLLRAYGCSLAKIRREYVARFAYTDEQKEELADWYGNLINMMNTEGCRQTGHLQINNIVMQQLEELNNRLLASQKYPFYTSEYYRVLPFIVELRRKSTEADSGRALPSEIETCFNALYGTMLLRLQNKTISPDTQHAINEITTFVGMLSDYYKKDNQQPLEL